MSTVQPAGRAEAPRPCCAHAAAAATTLGTLLRRALGNALGRSARRRPSASLELGSRGGARLAIAHGELVVLSGLQDQTLVCETGEVWVTLDRDCNDHVLQRGQRLAIASNASAIVTATRPSLVRVTAWPAARELR